MNIIRRTIERERLDDEEGYYSLQRAFSGESLLYTVSCTSSRLVWASAHVLGYQHAGTGWGPQQLSVVWGLSESYSYL